VADKYQKTEKGTVKHRKEMREKGSVARSAELSGWASFLVVASLLPWLGGLAANRVNGFLQNTIEAMGHPSLVTAIAILAQGLATTAFAALPVLLVGTLAATSVAVAQVGLRFTPKAFKFKFSRLSPKTGIKRIVSSEGLWSLVKTLLKMVILAVVGYLILRQLVHSVMGGATLPLQDTLSAGASTVGGLMRMIGALALALAIGDYFFQRRKYQQDLRMTKQEVKDEHRQSDGSPEMRRAQRGRARKLSRQQMMAAVARADVVVTNPTHFAVAIAYDRTTDRAPRVVAKGGDLIAAAIKERARECGVVIVENPLLARTLYATCEVDDIVSPALYASVARLLAFVYSLTPTAKTFRDVHVMAS
jgi:flagellar biosynthetic protein FlhB